MKLRCHQTGVKYRLNWLTNEADGFRLTDLILIIAFRSEFEPCDNCGIYEGAKMMLFAKHLSGFTDVLMKSDLSPLNAKENFRRWAILRSYTDMISFQLTLYATADIISQMDRPTTVDRIQ